MKRISRVLEHFEEVSLGVMVCFTLLLIFANVFLRYGFGRTFTWAEELSRFLFVAITYIGAAAGVRRKRHIIVDLIAVLLPVTSSYLIKLSNLLALIFSLLLFYSTIRYATHLFQIKQVAIGLQIPMWIPYLGVVLGSLLLSYRFAQAFYINLKQKPD